jgi:hypothetical protein
MAQRRALPAALLCLAVLLASAPVQAQLTENLGGLTDENFPGYLGPMNTGLSGTMNAGIFRTGHVPKAGFNLDVDLLTMAIGFEDEDMVYLPIDPEGFTSLEPTEVPTVIGSPDGVEVAGEGGLTQIYPGGFDLDGFEIAVPQVTVGSVFGTRAIIRYIMFDLGDTDVGDFKYFGIGAQHSLTQYFSDAPFDLAAGFLWQNFEVGETVDATATHFNITASKQYKYFRPYLGFGIDTIQTDAKYDDEEDPENSFDVSLDRETDPRFTAGVAGTIPHFSIFFEISSGAATSIAVGLSIGS